ncbi:MAG: glycoside hydrolase family 3 protein [Patescibacteria group bacterium]|nr:glycoside hydrolase family 3 protein [Patescibacteria group bacterium]
MLISLILIFFYIYYFVFDSDKSFELVRVCQDRNVSGCRIDNLVYTDSALLIDERVKDLLGRMTIQEKIGQMMLIERNSLKSNDDIALYGMGGLLSGMGSKPETNTPEGWLNMVNDYSRISKNTRLGIPVIYGADAIHGHTNIEKATVFPHFIGLGATGDEDIVRKVAKATTEELAASGVYWNFSPNLDVLGDPRWGRFFESFGSSPELVSRLGGAYLEGIAEYNSSSYNPIGTAKHFIGAGAMTWGSSYNKDFEIDQGESDMSIDELRQRHLPSFKKAIDEGVSTVMVGLNSWENKKLSENKYLITDVLKGELGFEGFVVSDWYAVYEIDKNKYKSAVIAINSGIDMVMVPFEYELFMGDMYEAVMSGDISQERIDDAVERILKVKFAIGLFDNPEPNTDNLSDIGSDEHREIAREAVSKSLVVLKNEKNILPLSSDMKKIHVAGSAADNLGMQLGGWSVEWQGIDGNWTPGTNILQGIIEVSPKDVEITYNEEGIFENKKEIADVGIVVVGEKPYAEGRGDKSDLSLSKEDLVAIENIHLNSKKIVVIIISGRILNIKNQIDSWDAAIEAWLPGSEGGGVADTLFGIRPFVGKLPIN